MVVDRGAEGGDDDLAGDCWVGGDRQQVAGVVVEPGEDLDVGAVSESPVGEVGLPRFVRHLGCEPDVGGLRPLGRGGGHRAGADQDPVDRGPRHDDLVAVS